MSVLCRRLCPAAAAFSRRSPAAASSSFSASSRLSRSSSLCSASVSHSPGHPSPSSPHRSFSGAAYRDGEVIALAGRQWELAMLGNFPDAPTVQPFGTMARPSVIYSGKKKRIVGCLGGGQYAHRLQWFQLKEGKKHVCSQCGQVFLLINDNNYEQHKDLVDERTREQYDYFQSMMQQADKMGQKLPTAVLTEVGPDSKY